MKKILLRSTMIAVTVTVVLCIINWVMAIISGTILGITTWGGEYKARRGLGILIETFYPETRVDDPIQSSSIMSFDPISFITTLLFVFMIVFVINLILIQFGKEE